MSLEDVFNILQTRSISLIEQDGELVIHAPQGAMDQALMSKLKTHKQDLLAALKDGWVTVKPEGAKITPDMLPLISLTQNEIDLIVDGVAEGAAGIKDIYPLVPLQEGILFHHLLETQGDPYITRSIIVFDNRARLDAFLGALQTVIDRHDILRSSVHWNGLPQPVQVVHRRAVLPVEELEPVEQGKIHQCLLERTDPRQLRMDLQKAPLLAGFAIKNSQSEQYWFAMLNHHLVNDHHTLRLILSEIRQLLNGLTDQLPPIQPFRNFIAQMRTDSPADHEDYFRRQLGDIDEPTAPFGLLNVQGDGRQVVEAVLPLEPELAQRIRNSARQHSVTPAALFHLAWSLVISQSCGRNDVVFGTVLFGRLQGGITGADRAVGMFINTLPIRVSLGGRTVREIIDITHHNLNELLMHEQASLALAKRCSAVPASMPLFTALLNYRHSNMITATDQSALLEWDGMRVISSEERSNYPLTLSVDDLGRDFSLTVQCISEIDPARIAEYLRTAMRGLVTALEQNTRQLANAIDIMPEAERRQILFDFNATAVAYSDRQSLHALFEVQAKKTPDADAIAFAGQTLSYAELNARANHVAHYLRSKGIGPDVPVGLCVERSLEMAVGMLGILKAGGAYVPLDPLYPEERIAYMLHDAQIAVLLTQQRLWHRAAETIYLDSDWSDIARCPADNPVLCSHPLDLAYIIYTSGSTGQPKGVTISHRNAVHSTNARLASYREPVTAYLLLSSFAFDSSVAGLFWTLGQGGCLCLPTDAATKDPAALAEIIVNRRVSHLLALPSFYALLLNQAGAQLKTLKTAIVAGEACQTEVVKQHYAILPDVRLYNEYGPTEATVWSSVYPVSPNDLDRPLSIGRPIDNVRLYILDRIGRPVPTGVRGELHIGGAGVGRGYWRRPDLTADKFIPDPFQADGGRLYKTGDLARYRPNGNVEFLGRVDDQVKIRGFRIELGEIEARLIEAPEINEAVVIAREDQPGNKRLVAYLVATTEHAVNIDQCKARLKVVLPDYMIPTAFVMLDSMPLSANGKLDRKRLPQPDMSRIPTQHYHKPQNPVERILADIWRDLLGIKQVGRHDNFFELGGDSILSIQVVSRARQAGVVITPKQLFQNQTLSALAVAAEQIQQLSTEQGLVSGNVPLTPIQHWFFEQSLSNPHHWNQALLLTIKPGLAPDVFETALKQLLNHHDALRMRFGHGDNGWLQTNLVKERQPIFERIDLSGVPVERQTERLQAEASIKQATLHLTEGPLLRAAWFDFGGERDSRVLIAIHHLVVDGVSWRILLEDLNSACRQLMAGQTVSLPAKTTSFKQWAERMRQLANTDDSTPDASYWLNPSRNIVPVLPIDNESGGNHIGLEDEIVVSLSAAETRTLLQEVPLAYRTRIDEVLLTALALTLRDWTQSTTLLIDMEGHGREDLAIDLDVSRTVGWFSSVYPVLLTLTDDCSSSGALKAVKEQLRAVPVKGIAYGWLRYLSDDEALKIQLAALPQAQIIFNYLGQFDTVMSAGEPCEPNLQSAGVSHDPADKRAHELDIIGSISDGCLRLSWRYSRERYRRTTLETLTGHYLRQLKNLIVHCAQADVGGYTRSDFPLATLSQTELDSMALKPRQIEDIYPLAPLQHGLIFHSLYAPESSVYCIQLACRLRGKLNLAFFLQAWRQLLERHPVLRTRFYFKDREQPLQIIDKQARLPISEHDWRGIPMDQQQQRWQQVLADDHAKGFDFSRSPLMRLALARCSSDTHYFLWSYHHVLLDGWSAPLLINDVFTAYQALQRGDTPRLPTVKPYRDYIVWLQQQDMVAAENYWRIALAGFTEPLALGSDQALGYLGETSGSGKQTLLLSEAETLALQRFVKRRQLTLNTLTQAAWGLLLSRYGDSGDVVFGVTVSGRPAELANVEGMVGLFINSLPMRLQLRPESRVSDWLQALFEQNQDMRRYEYASLAKIQSWSELPRGQNLFDTLLVFENYPIDQALTEVGGPIRIDEVGGVDPNNYPLMLSILPGSRLKLEISHDMARFAAKTVAAMLAHLRQLLTAFAEQPESRLYELPTLTPDERQQILHDWNATNVDYPKDRCIHQLFEAQVKKTPDAVALGFEKQVLSYAELNANANQLAHYLRSNGVGPDVLVGICVERSLEMVIGLLAILKAGGAYVPLDPGYPQDRLEFMLHDVSAPIVLTQEACRRKLEASTATVLCLDSEWGIVAKFCDANPDIPLMPESLAYCIYTSGSTGQPKGAGVPHQGILNRLQWMQQQYGLDQTDRILQKTPYSFDVSVWEFFWPLMTGARLVIAKPKLHTDSSALVDMIRSEGITTVHFVPSMLQVFIETPGVENCTSLSRVICSGEALPADLVARFQQKLPVVLHNLYGPTEASVDVSHWSCVPGHIEMAIPIGRPIANISLYILDRYLNPVPVGTPGELHITGIGLGRGYLNRPDLTADKFIPNPFGPAGERLYKTGDLVRYRFDGNIDYLGRIDHQVKIRGFRIELGEIEAQLLAYPSVKEAVVLAREDQPNDKRLVAYLVESQTGTTQIDSLKARLKNALPDYMVPSAFVLLDEMPLGANGKLDRKRLMPPGVSEQRCKQYIAPDTQTETILSEIWQEILGLEQVGIEDNFFELGGHSLLATQLYFLVKKRLAATVAFNVFLTEPTVAAQARLIDGEAGQTIDFDAEAVLDPSIVPLAADAIDAAAARTIFLTGATGFLGVFLLADLLEHGQADIYCLVRARDEHQALVRLQQQVGLYELTERVDFSRVIAVCGDLAEPNFGLSESRYREIAERSEVIYHNGALVNFVQPYQTLKVANVTGTEEVLRLACHGRPKAIHYVSTVSVFSEAPCHVTGHKETDEPEQHGNLPNGYAESKWVAEKLVIAARERGFQVSIYRPAIVAGDSRSGAWNTGDFWCRLVKGCLQMGYAPRERIRMDMAPVNYMSRSIVALSQQAYAVGGIFHLNHPEPPYSDEWVDFYTSLGYRLQRIPYRDWLEKVLEFGHSNPNGFALASLLPMFAGQLQDGDAQLPEDGAPQYDSRATHKALSALNVECELLDRKIMARYQDYFVRKGFVVGPNGEALNSLRII